MGRERRGTAGGRVMIQLVSRRLLTQMPVFNSRPVYMGFVVKKSRIGTSFSSGTLIFLRKCYPPASGLYSFSSTTDAIRCNLSSLHCC